MIRETTSDYHIQIDGPNECCPASLDPEDHHTHVDDDTFLCCPVPTGSHLSGVFLSDRLTRLDDFARKNFNMALLCLVYTGINIVCTIINAMSQDFRDSHEFAFHMLEFWATFFFSVVQVYALIFSPRSLGSIYKNPNLLKVIIFFNVAATFVPSALVAFSLESFEVLSHEMEYINELTMSFVDLVLIAAMLSRTKDRPVDSPWFTLVATLVATAVAIIQLGIYNFLGGYLDPPGPGEQVAHFFEFAFEIISALISFSFCMDNKLMCDEKMRQLLKIQNTVVHSHNGHNHTHHAKVPRSQKPHKVSRCHFLKRTLLNLE